MLPRRPAKEPPGLDAGPAGRAEACERRHGALDGPLVQRASEGLNFMADSYLTIPQIISDGASITFKLPSIPYIFHIANLSVTVTSNTPSVTVRDTFPIGFRNLQILPHIYIITSSYSLDVTTDNYFALKVDKENVGLHYANYMGNFQSRGILGIDQFQERFSVYDGNSKLASLWAYMWLYYDNGVYTNNITFTPYGTSSVISGTSICDVSCIVF